MSISAYRLSRTIINNNAVSWERWMPILSWITGWANVAGWVRTPDILITAELTVFQVALVATGGLLGSELVIGVISLMHPVCL